MIIQGKYEGVRMIDSHIHADTRPYEDFEKMAIAGLDIAITCAHDPLRMTSADVVMDHWHRIINNDVKRAADNGLKLYAAIGIHPRSISKDFDIALSKLSSLVHNDNVVAIGEIGLEKVSKSQKDIFKIQLSLAEDLNVPVMVHTPRTNKKEVTEVTLDIIEENISPDMVVVDHVDDSIIESVIELGTMLGVTVQPQKMTPDEAVCLLEEYGIERVFLDSDISSSPSDPLSVPKTVHKMKLAEFREEDIKKVSNDNALNFFLGNKI